MRWWYTLLFINLIKCIINITNYKNPNFTRCLDVALEAGTYASVLLNHSAPTWALHWIHSLSIALRQITHGRDVPWPPSTRTLVTMKSPYLRWIHDENLADPTPWRDAWSWRLRISFLSAQQWQSLATEGPYGTPTGLANDHRMIIHCIKHAAPF